VNCSIERGKRCCAHAFLQWNIRGQCETRAGVSEVSTNSRANIDIDHVARTQASHPGNPMGDFLVDTDARRARETISHSRRRFGVSLGQPVCAERIQLGRGHPRFGSVAHASQYFGDDVPGGPQAIELVFGLNRHGASASPHGSH